MIAARYKLNEARNILGKLFTVAAVNGKVIEITKKGVPATAVIAPKERLVGRGTGQYVEKLARVIGENLLSDADDALLAAQVGELAQLPLPKLAALSQIPSLPLSGEQRAAMVEAVGEEAISRLEKRYLIAKTLKEAEEQGLYDLAEDAANRLDL